MATEEDLLTALREVADQRKRIEEDEETRIVAALKARVRPSRIERSIGRSREHVRKIRVKHGIPPYR